MERLGERDSKQQELKEHVTSKRTPDCCSPPYLSTPFSTKPSGGAEQGTVCCGMVGGRAHPRGRRCQSTSRLRKASAWEGDRYGVSVHKKRVKVKVNITNNGTNQSQVTLDRMHSKENSITCVDIPAKDA